MNPSKSSRRKPFEPETENCCGRVPSTKRLLLPFIRPFSDFILVPSLSLSHTPDLFHWLSFQRSKSFFFVADIPIPSPRLWSPPYRHSHSLRPSLFKTKKKSVTGNQNKVWVFSYIWTLHSDFGSVTTNIIIKSTKRPELGNVAKGMKRDKGWPITRPSFGCVPSNLTVSSSHC